MGIMENNMETTIVFWGYIGEPWTLASAKVKYGAAGDSSVACQPMLPDNARDQNQGCNYSSSLNYHELMVGKVILFIGRKDIW